MPRSQCRCPQALPWLHARKKKQNKINIENKFIAKYKLEGHPLNRHLEVASPWWSISMTIIFTVILDIAALEATLWAQLYIKGFGYTFHTVLAFLQPFFPQLHQYFERNETYGHVMIYIRTRIRISLLKSVLISIRGIRGKGYKKTTPISFVLFNLIPQEDAYECPWAVMVSLCSSLYCISKMQIFILFCIED